MYWLGEDVLQPADAPPLTRAICGWVPRLLGAPHPRDTTGWKERDAYMIGAEILDRPNIRARRLLFYTRLPFLVLPAADRFPALALGPPVVRRTDRALSCRVRRAGADHSRPRRSHQLRRRLPLLARFGSAMRRGGIGGSPQFTAAGGVGTGNHGPGCADQIHAAAASDLGLRTGALEGPARAGLLLSIPRRRSMAGSWQHRSFRRSRFRPRKSGSSTAPECRRGRFPALSCWRSCRGRCNSCAA